MRILLPVLVVSRKERYLTDLCPMSRRWRGCGDDGPCTPHATSYRVLLHSISENYALLVLRDKCWVEAVAGSWNLRIVFLI